MRPDMNAEIRGVVEQATLYRSLGAPDGYDFGVISCTYQVDVSGPSGLDGGIQNGLGYLAKALGDHNPQFTVRPRRQSGYQHPPIDSNAEVQMFVMSRGNDVRGLIVLFPKSQSALADRIIQSIKWVLEE